MESEGQNLPKVPQLLDGRAHIENHIRQPQSMCPFSLHQMTPRSGEDEAQAQGGIQRGPEKKGVGGLEDRPRHLVTWWGGSRLWRKGHRALRVRVGVGVQREID